MAQKVVRSPFPGTFYRRPDPDSDPYVGEGDAVSVGDVIGLIEIMKTFHEVKSEEEGTAERFLVENEELIEVGQEILLLAD
jgi:acetyl-CoA carboxylase biotin carboxyl carrier protein